MTSYQEEKADELKRLAQEKGETVERKQEVIDVVPRDSKKARASFPIDEIEMARAWLQLWVSSDTEV
ncbi:MAG TPA: hypothetical protein VHV10_05635 [Ktedonobacteraceae bacterium]|jgi:hypothetical protein|nr:hypothetical protein [Ktedonobacteraceae bacterium]